MIVLSIQSTCKKKKEQKRTKFCQTLKPFKCETDMSHMRKNRFWVALVLLQINEHQCSQPLANQHTLVSVTTIPAAHEYHVRHGSILTPHKERCCYCQQNSKKSWTSRHCPFCILLVWSALCQTTMLSGTPLDDIQCSLWFSKRLTCPSNIASLPVEWPSSWSYK